MSVNVEKVNLEIAQLEYQSKELEQQIWKLQEEQDKIQKQISENRLILEREQYHGVSKAEYLVSIRGTQFKEGEYIITIGVPHNQSLLVQTMDGDMEVTLHGGMLKLNRKADYVKGVKWYEKTYYSDGIPKSRQKQYDEMGALRDKYTAMMENAEIQPVESV